VTADRVERLAGLLREREVDLLLVGAPVDVRYLAGFTGSNGLALVAAREDAEQRFFTDFRYETQSAEQVPELFMREIVSIDLAEAAVRSLEPRSTGAGGGEESGSGGGPGLGAESGSRTRPGARTESGVKAGRVGFDDAATTVKQHTRLREHLPAGWELVPCGGLVAGLREVKDAGEQERIRAAALLADTALGEVLEQGVVGRTERDVAIELELRMRRLGAEAPSFPSIVAAGPHSALPHAEPRPVPIPKDTLLTIDWGALLDGYCSDCTRTFATGAIGEQEREVYELVRRAQAKAQAAVRAGPSGREIDAVARTVIDAAGHGEHFGHGLGHGVGLEVHEAPRLSRTAGEQALRVGNVVTVEPGVYLPGRFGVRIEDLVVVRENGGESLSGLPKELTEVS
jgi:Xaa-Pro aminopeptidase